MSKRKFDEVEGTVEEVTVEDASDRAHRHLKPGYARVPLEHIGFWEHNRGGGGVCPHHVHTVAHDILTNMTKLPRYKHVALIELPVEDLQRHLDLNRVGCESDELMPKYSDKIKYVCATCTHFVHAQKLISDGSRSVWNDGDLKLQVRKEDIEGREILASGPLCAIYKASLMQDLDAAQALASDDNLNASVTWEEGEDQCFGRVHHMMARLYPEAPPKNEGGNEGNKQGSNGGTERRQFDVKDMITQLQVAGLGSLPMSDWEALISLRASLPTPIAEVFITCQFHSCAGQVRVRASDFGLAARLDPRTPWVKVCLLLAQYIGNLEQRALKGATRLSTFAGRKEKTAVLLKKDVIAELMTETRLLRELEHFVLQMVKHYGTPHKKGGLTMMKSVADKELLGARGLCFSWCGRYLIKTGETLKNSSVKALSMGDVVSLDQRQKLLVKETAGKLHTIEGWFRKTLMTRGLYDEVSLPTALYPPALPVAKSSTAVAPSQGGAAANPMPAAPSGAGLDPKVLTEAHVFQKLQISSLGEFVMALIPVDGATDAADTQPVVDSDGVTVEVAALKTEAAVVKPETSDVKEEEVVETNGLSDVNENECSPVCERAWRQVLLVTLSLPNATVALARRGPVPPSGTRQRLDHFVVSVDDLRPITFTKDPKSNAKAFHPSLEDVGDPLDALDIDFMQSSYCHMVMGHCALWAFECAGHCLESVGVSRVGDKDEGPLTLQVRAKVGFRKGTLILAPAYGEMKLASEHHEFASAKEFEKNRKNIHADMLSHVDATVAFAFKINGKSNKDAAPAKKHHFVMYSPLLAIRPEKKDEPKHTLKNVAPFWALLRAGGKSAQHNMELDTISFRDLGFEAMGSAYPKLPRGISCTACLPIARNVKNISVGEVLTLPYMHAKDPED